MKSWRSMALRATIIQTSVLMLLLIIQPSHCEAGANFFGLDDRQRYDIHVASYEDVGVFVIQNIEIVELVEIEDRTFLVIQTDNFDAKRSKGLIRFDYVRAILPSMKHINIQSPVRLHR